VASITRVRRPRTGVVLLELDAVLPTCAVLDQVRLIGRQSTAPLATMYVVTRCDSQADGPFHRLPAPLPADVREGDLVCFPCLATVRHRDVVEPVRAELAPARPVHSEFIRADVRNALPAEDPGHRVQRST
jgi:hypothetical protein